ncbi:MAG: hypothetical protein NVSMB5_04930 [Candidatus Velthaea sp.]
MRAGGFDGWQMTGFTAGTSIAVRPALRASDESAERPQKRARGFGMHVIYSDEQRVETSIEEVFEARYVDKSTLLERSD